MPDRRIVLLILALWALLLIRLNAPYYGIQDAYRVWIPAAIRNLDEYNTILVVRNSAPTPVDELAIYTHHPPLLVWLPAILTQFTGFNETSVRFVFAAATMFSLSGFYVFTRRLYNRNLALIASAFFAFTPMVAYFGRVAGHDPLGLATAMVFAAALVNWLRYPTRQRYGLLMLLAWLSVWTAWPAVFFVAFLSLAGLGSRQHRLGVIGLGMVTIAAFITMMLLYESQHSGAFNDLLKSFGWRSSSYSGQIGTERFNLLQWLSVNFQHVLLFATIGFTALALWGIPALWKHRQPLTLLLFVAGFIYLLVFRNASYIHDYYKIFLVPAMAISAAVVWTDVYPRAGRYGRPLIVSITVAALIQAVVVFGLLHASGRQPLFDEIITYLQNNAAPTDTIAVNVDTGDDSYDRVIEFYIFRPIIWNEEFETALELAEGDLLFMDCRRSTVNPQPNLDYCTSIRTP